MAGQVRARLAISRGCWRSPKLELLLVDPEAHFYVTHRRSASDFVRLYGKTDLKDIEVLLEHLDTGGFIEHLEELGIGIGCHQ
jgi:hypothetical protein